MNFIDGTSVGLIGRKQNAIVLDYKKTIVITTDILKHNEDATEPHITLNDVEQKVEVFAKNILLESASSQRTEESLVYGESLVELLRWMITIMKTHKHPPNGSPIPDFFQEANSRARNMDVDLLNKQVKTR